MIAINKRVSKLGEGVCSEINEKSQLVFIAIFFIVSISLFIKFNVDKHLSQDGVNYFFRILENQDYAYVAWSRRFTEYLTEWPLVLAVRSGVTDIELLIDIFSYGIYFPYLASFLLCLYVVRDEDKSLLWFPIAGYFGFNVLSDYDLIADHHAMAVMTWPILLMLLKTRPLIWTEGVVLTILLVLYTRMYETAVLTAGLLVVVSVIRIFRYRKQRELVLMVTSILLLMVVMLIAVIYIVDPRSPANRGSFLDSIWVNKRNWEALATCSFIGIFSIGWIISDKWKKIKNLVFSFAIVPIIYYVFLRFTTDYAMTAYISFSSRTLSGIVLPGLILLAAIVVYGKRTLNRVGICASLIAFLVMTGFNLADLRYWTGVKQEFLAVLNSDARYISIDDTILRNNHYRWSWNNPLLSLAWSSPCVRTIVMNTPGDPEGPINPRERLVLKRYLKYDEYFKKIDPTINVCDK
jgi:hypothetical protein